MTIKSFFLGDTMTGNTAPKVTTPSANTVPQSVTSVTDLLSRCEELKKMETTSKKTRDEHTAKITLQKTTLLNDATACWDAIQQVGLLIEGYGIPPSKLKKFHLNAASLRKELKTKLPANPTKKSKK